MLQIIYLILTACLMQLYIPWYIMHHIVINATLVWIARKVYVRASIIYQVILKCWIPKLYKE